MRQTSTLSAGFQPTVPARKRSKTRNLYRKPLGSAVLRKNRAKFPRKELCLIDDGTICITTDRNDVKDLEYRNNIYGAGLFKEITGGTQHNKPKFLSILKPCSKSP
jgi:hypothetical protein